MNLKLYGRLGWQWTAAGETWRTGPDGCGLYCGKMLLDAAFVAPRSRVAMLKLIGQKEIDNVYSH